MREDFLHYLWKTRHFNQKDLTLTTGEPLFIVDTGSHNSDAGPDFQQARIRIGDTLWIGQVEMHLCASDWLRHGHDKDPAYENVILHVVYEADENIVLRSKTKNNPAQYLPCLELKNKIPQNIFQKYWGMMQSKAWIPCAAHFPNVSSFTRTACLDPLIIERLEQKVLIIEQSLDENKQDWEETFYQKMARAFGSKVNAEPMEQLARSIPHKLLAKHKDNLFQLEAILFGQAGWLNASFADTYPNLLTKEYRFLSHKHTLKPMSPTGVEWKFSKIRPPNFPTIRLAQFANLVHQSVHLFSKILEKETLTEVEELLESGVSDYWTTHYIFDSASIPKPKSFGKKAIQGVLLNTVIPFLFLYGKLKGLPVFKNRALDWLETLPAEDNHIIENWKALGMIAQSGAESQALLQLKTAYCEQQRCLECKIGHNILRQNP
jgi:Protein of unknown function (DUF2851)